MSTEKDPRLEELLLEARQTAKQIPRWMMSQDLRESLECDHPREALDHEMDTLPSEDD